MINQQNTSPTNKSLYAESKNILENIKEDEFNISLFIKKLEELKELEEKKQNPITWVPDEWDNWYEGH